MRSHALNAPQAPHAPEQKRSGFKNRYWDIYYAFNGLKKKKWMDKNPAIEFLAIIFGVFFLFPITLRIKRERKKHEKNSEKRSSSCWMESHGQKYTEHRLMTHVIPLDLLLSTQRTCNIRSHSAHEFCIHFFYSSIIAISTLFLKQKMIRLTPADTLIGAFKCDILILTICKYLHTRKTKTKKKGKKTVQMKAFRAMDHLSPCVTLFHFFLYTSFWALGAKKSCQSKAKKKLWLHSSLSEKTRQTINYLTAISCEIWKRTTMIFISHLGQNPLRLISSTMIYWGRQFWRILTASVILCVCVWLRWLMFEWHDRYVASR